MKFVDADSPTYAKNKHCEFWLQGSGGGVLASPRHSLPRNSTCLYHLRGAGPALPSPTPPRPLPKFPEQRPGTVWRRPAPRAPQPQFRVWLSILKFHVGTSLSTGDEDCSTTLMVWDGEMMPLSECYDPTWLVLFWLIIVSCAKVCEIWSILKSLQSWYWDYFYFINMLIFIFDAVSILLNCIAWTKSMYRMINA